MRLRRLLPAALLLTVLALPSLHGARAAPPPPAEGAVIALAATGADRANTLAYSPDGRWLAVGTATGWALYDAQTRAPLHVVSTATWVRSLAFSPDGQTLVTGSYDPTVRLWRAADGVLLQELSGHASWVRAVAFSADGDTVASASDDHTVRLWSASTGQVRRTLSDGTQGVRTLAFSPNGQLLATGGYDNVIRLWRVADGALLRLLEGHTGWVRALAFSPGGATLASGGFDATARLWRVADGALLHTLAGHTASVLSVAFSPDGDTLATGSVDTTVRLWQVADPSTPAPAEAGVNGGGRGGALLGRLTGHRDFVFAVMFSPGGDTLASGAVDNTVRLWALTPEALAAAAEEVARVDDHATSSNCVVCHHPHGDLRRPGVVGQPARVIEAGCGLCHAQGALVFNWCPAMVRAPETPHVVVAPPAVDARAGVPRGTRNLSVIMSTPGNGEHWYASGKLRSIVLVNGLVNVTGSPLADVTVHLELWNAGQLVDVLTTRPHPDGAFTFGVNLNPEGSNLDLPIDLLDCLPCHDPDQANIVLAGANMTNVSLSGEVRLAVAATTPAGETATDERWIRVDRSRALSVPVQAYLDGDPAQPIGSLRVDAATLLYEWRGLTFGGTTGPNGTASLLVEALSEVPTHYTFHVPPTVVDGVLYAGLAPVEVTLPPGAESAAPVTLAVQGQSGSLAGRLSGAAAQPAGPVPIRAVHLPDGLRYQTHTSADGTFAFADLPVDRYLVVADPEALAAQGLASVPQTVDLAQAPSAEVTLPLAPLEGLGFAALVADPQGQPLPFAWLAAGEGGLGQRVSPETGGLTLAGLPAGTRGLVASAPGFYSQAQAVGAEPHSFDFRLVLRPDTRRLAWGEGEVFIPAETLATVDGRRIVLERGWLWGQGASDQAWMISTAGLVISLSDGRFALEQLPGESAWLYLLDGEATVYRPEAPNQVTRLSAGSMLALPETGTLVAVPLDSAVIGALSPAAGAAPALVWEPTPAAQVRDRLALVGITTAQVVTFATYALALAALFTLPLIALVWRRRRA